MGTFIMVLQSVVIFVMLFIQFSKNTEDYCKKLWFYLLFCLGMRLGL